MGLGDFFKKIFKNPVKSMALIPSFGKEKKEGGSDSTLPSMDLAGVNPVKGNTKAGAGKSASTGLFSTKAAQSIFTNPSAGYYTSGSTGTSVPNYNRIGNFKDIENPNENYLEKLFGIMNNPVPDSSPASSSYQKMRERWLNRIYA